MRAGCTAEPKKFRPAADPLPGAQDGQNLISRRQIYLQTQFGEDRSTQFQVIVLTDPHTNKHAHTHTQTHKQDRLHYTAPLSLARSVMRTQIVKYDMKCANGVYKYKT